MHIIYEKADGLIQASVAELPGAISLGESVEEARRNLKEAIEMVRAGRAEDGERDGGDIRRLNRDSRHHIPWRPLSDISQVEESYADSVVSRSISIR